MKLTQEQIEYFAEVKLSIKRHSFVKDFGFRVEDDMGGTWYEKDLSSDEYFTFGGNTGEDDYQNVIGSKASNVNICHMNHGGEVLEIYHLHLVLDIKEDTIVTQKIAEKFLEQFNNGKLPQTK